MKVVFDVNVDNLISFDKVGFSYTKNRPILEKISFELAAGESLALVGPSGLGKSTLLKLVDGSILPDEGAISVCGQNMGELSRGKRLALRRNNLGLIFQTPRLIPELSILENVTLPALLNKVNKKEAYGRAYELLKNFDIDSTLPVAVLSGGQACRVSVARALITRPSLLVADEPTASLDPALVNTVTSLLLDCCKEDTALLLVTHDTAVAKRCSRVLKLEAQTEPSMGATLTENIAQPC